MQTVSRHPSPQTLAEFAAGRLDEARAVVVSAHAAHCSACARTVSDLEAVGGVLLEDMAPVAMAPDALETVLARAGDIVAPAHGDQRVDPIDAAMRGDFDAVPWKRVAPGVHQHVVEAQGYRKGVLRLVKFAPGHGVPAHSHGDNELTLLLDGAYRDAFGEWRAGDLADLDGDHTHEPIAIGEKPCVCLIATSAPLAFKTLIGRAMQPFVRM